MNEPRFKAEDLKDAATCKQEDPMVSLGKAAAQVRELRDYAAQYLSAKADGIKVKARKAVVLGVLGLLALIVGAVVLITAASLMVIGLAELIGSALGGRMWAGNLIVGVGILVMLGIGAWWGVRKLFNSSAASTVKRYEQRLKNQRAAHGHDARQRASETV